MSHHKHRRLKFKSLFVWHRHLGLLVAALVVLLATTGFALNHTEEFRLNSRYVLQTWLLDWYGIAAPAQYTAFSTAAGSLTLLGSQLYWGEDRLDGTYERLRGAIALDTVLVVALDQELLLLTRTGETLARLTTFDGIPQAIKRIGSTADGRLIVASAAGMYMPDNDFLGWTICSGTTLAIHWSEASELDATLHRHLMKSYRSEILPWERVILDVHSGRFFGNYGVWVMDGAAVLMCFLAGSGVSLWLKRKRRH